MTAEEMRALGQLEGKVDMILDNLKTRPCLVHDREITTIKTKLRFIAVIWGGFVSLVVSIVTAIITAWVGRPDR